MWREPGNPLRVLEFMGEVNRLTGTVRAGSFTLARIAGRWVIRPRTVGRSIRSASVEVDISRRTSPIFRYQYRSLRPARKVTIHS